LRYTSLGLLSYIALKYNWYCTSALFLGLMWHQLVFTAHDAGHMGITHDPVMDTTIGIIIADFIGGLSIGWWKKNHNVHHIVTNHPEHDPDIQRILAITTFSSVNVLRSSNDIRCICKNHD
jgi:delta8-fatty-acid desaturase